MIKINVKLIGRTLTVLSYIYLLFLVVSYVVAFVLCGAVEIIGDGQLENWYLFGAIVSIVILLPQAINRMLLPDIAKWRNEVAKKEVRKANKKVEQKDKIEE